MKQHIAATCRIFEQHNEMLPKSLASSTTRSSTRRRHRFVERAASSSSSSKPSLASPLLASLLASEFPSHLRSDSLSVAKMRDASSLNASIDALPPVWFRFAPVMLTRLMMTLEQQQQKTQQQQEEEAARENVLLVPRLLQHLALRCGGAHILSDLLPQHFRAMLLRDQQLQQQQQNVLQFDATTERITDSNIEAFLVLSPPERWQDAFQWRTIDAISLPINRVFRFVLANPAFEDSGPQRFAEAHRALLRCLFASSPVWTHRGLTRFQCPVAPHFFQKAQVLYGKAARPDLLIELVESAAIACFAAATRPQFQKQQHEQQIKIAPVSDFFDTATASLVEPLALSDLPAVAALSAPAMELRSKQLPFLITASSRRNADFLGSARRWQLSRRGLVLALTLMAPRFAANAAELFPVDPDDETINNNDNDEDDHNMRWELCIKCACNAAVFTATDDDDASFRELAKMHPLQASASGHAGAAAADDEEDEAGTKVSDRFISVYETVTAVCRQVAPKRLHQSTLLVLSHFVDSLETRNKVLGFLERGLAKTLPMVVGLSSAKVALQEQIVAAAATAPVTTSDVPSAVSILKQCVLQQISESQSTTSIRDSKSLKLPPPPAPTHHLVPLIVAAAERAVGPAAQSSRPLDALERIVRCLAVELLAEQVIPTGNSQQRQQQQLQHRPPANKLQQPLPPTPLLLHHRKFAVSLLLGNSRVRSALEAATTTDEQYTALLIALLRRFGVICDPVMKAACGTSDSNIDDSNDEEPQFNFDVEGRKSLWVIPPARASQIGDAQEEQQRQEEQTAAMLKVNAAYRRLVTASSATWECGCGETVLWPARSCLACLAEKPHQNLRRQERDDIGRVDVAVAAVTATSNESLVDDFGDLFSNTNRNDSNSSSQQQRPPPTLMKCPNCHHRLKPSAFSLTGSDSLWCPCCTSSHPAVTALNKTLLLSRLDGVWECPNCPGQLAADSQSCPQCARRNPAAASASSSSAAGGHSHHHHLRCQRCGTTGNSPNDITCHNGCGALRFQSQALRSLQVRKKPEEPLLLLWCCNSCATLNLLASTTQERARCVSCEAVQSFTSNEAETATQPIIVVPYQQWTCGCGAVNSPTHLNCVECSKSSSAAQETSNNNKFTCRSCRRPVDLDLTRRVEQNEEMTQLEQKSSRQDRDAECLVAPWRLQLGSATSHTNRCPHCDAPHPVDILRLQRPAWSLCSECDGVVAVGGSTATNVCAKCAEKHQRHHHRRHESQLQETHSVVATTTTRVSFTSVPWTCHKCGFSNAVHPLVLNQNANNNRNTTVNSDDKTSAAATAVVAPSGALLCGCCGTDRFPVALFSETEEWQCTGCGKKECVGFACSKCFNLHPYVPTTAVHTWVCAGSSCKALNPSWLAKCRSCGGTERMKAAQAKTAAAAAQEVELRYMTWHCKQQQQQQQIDLSKPTQRSRPPLCMLCGEQHTSLKCAPEHEAKRLDALEAGLMQLARRQSRVQQQPKSLSSSSSGSFNVDLLQQTFGGLSDDDSGRVPSSFGF